MSLEPDSTMVDYLNGELGLTFFVLFEEKSFRQAGERLGVSGTTIRNRMNQLEARLGFKLCSPYREFVPTPAGTLVHSRCQQAQQVLRTSISSALQQVAGPFLRIATTSIGLHIDLPQALYRWRQKQEHQDISIHLARPPSKEIVEMVNDGRVTFGLCGAHHLSEEARVKRSLFASPSLSVAYPRKPLDAEARGISMDQPNYRAIDLFFGWVAPSDSANTRERLEQLMGVPPRIRAEVGSHEDAVEYAAQGYAAVLTWSPLIRKHADQLVEVELDSTIEMPSKSGVLFYSEFTELTEWEVDFRDLFLEEMEASGRLH